MESNSRIEDLILITERLVDVLERENDALSNHRNVELRDILDEKVTLSRVYETRMKAISERPELLDDVDTEFRERLGSLGTQVSELVVQNGKLLKSAIESNRRVVELVTEAVCDAMPGVKTYGATGSSGAGTSNTKSQGATFSLDQTL